MKITVPIITYLDAINNKNVQRGDLINVSAKLPITEFFTILLWIRDLVITMDQYF